MQQIRLSARGKARQLLSTKSAYKPLSQGEAARLHALLEKSGVPDAESRLAASWQKAVLTYVAS